jgi:cell division protein FtsW (lipid II flippase)
MLMQEWLQAMWLGIGLCVLVVFGRRRQWKQENWFIAVLWVLFAWLCTFLPDQTPFRRFLGLCMTSVIAYLGGFLFGIKSPRNE